MKTFVIAQHLPILQVVLPLFCAPLCVLLRHKTLAWLIALIASWCSFVISILLLQQVLASGEITYAMGGWDVPWGIEYRLDTLNSFVLLIVTGIFSLVMSFAYKSVLKEISADRIYLFYTLILLNLTGLCGVIATGDAFNLFVFIEISSLSSYALISTGKQRQGLLAAYRYLIIGTIGASFILISVGLLYAMTGTLNITDIATRLSDLRDTRTIATAFAFCIVGICLKFALFPLHYWLPNIYAYSPSVVSALLAGTTSKVFLYILLRFIFDVFGADYAFNFMALDSVLIIIALLAIFIGSLSAIYQDNIKKILAYSSIAQVGYIILGISLASIAGLTAGILHLFNHALIKTTLFLTVACLFFRFDSNLLSNLKGCGRNMPWTMLAFVIAGLSMVGVPLTAGFISKWFLILAALEYSPWLVVFILVTSLLSVIYVWKIVEVLYFQTTPQDAKTIPYKEAPISMLLPLWVLVIANIYFGLNASFVIETSQHAANSLMLNQ